MKEFGFQMQTFHHSWKSYSEDHFPSTYQKLDQSKHKIFCKNTGDIPKNLKNTI